MDSEKRETEKRNLSASAEDSDAKRERIDEEAAPAWARSLIADVEHIRNTSNAIKQSVTELKAEMGKMRDDLEAVDVRVQRLELKAEETDRKILRLESENAALHAANEKLTDDSLRDSLSIHHIPRKGGRESWSETKAVLAKFLAEHSEGSEQQWSGKISRAHRGNKPGATVIHCLFRDWEYAQEVKEMFRQKRGKIGAVFVLDKFSIGTQERRNKAQARRDVERKNRPNAKIYIKYPAILMCKGVDDEEYLPIATF